MGRLGRGPASLPLREVSDERGSPRSLTELLVEADEEETDEEYGCALWRLLLLTVSRMDGGDAGEKDIVGATRLGCDHWSISSHRLDLAWYSGVSGVRRSRSR